MRFTLRIPEDSRVEVMSVAAPVGARVTLQSLTGRVNGGRGPREFGGGGPEVEVETVSGDVQVENGGQN